MVSLAFRASAIGFLVKNDHLSCVSVRHDHAGRCGVGELRIVDRAYGLVKGLRLCQIAHWQIHENHLAHDAFRGIVGANPNVSSRPIVFSNGSRGEALLWVRRLGMPVFSARSLALDGVSWVQGGEVENAVGWVSRVRQNRRRRLLPPSGVAPCGSSMRPPVSSISGPLGWCEFGSVSQHRVHDDREPASQSDAGLAHR